MEFALSDLCTDLACSGSPADELISLSVALQNQAFQIAVGSTTKTFLSLSLLCPYLQSWHYRRRQLHRPRCWPQLPPLLHIVFHAWWGRNDKDSLLTHSCWFLEKQIWLPIGAKGNTTEGTASRFQIWPSGEGNLEMLTTAESYRGKRRN